MKKSEQQLLEKFGISKAWIEKSAEEYESGNWEPSENDGTIYIGSHLDRVGKKRVTVIFDAADTQEVSNIAKKRGVKPSDIYRDALKQYLLTQA